MAKKVYIIDSDYWETLQTLVHDSLIEIHKAEPSYHVGEVKRKLEEMHSIIRSES